MGLKENFNQAMKDLLNRGLVSSESEEKAKAKSDLDAYLDVPQTAPSEAAPHSEDASGIVPGSMRGGPAPGEERGPAPSTEYGRAPYDQDAPDISMSSGSDDAWQSRQDNNRSAYYRPASNNNLNFSTYSSDGDYGRMFRQAEEMTTISKNTMIIGDIKTLANITIEGSVRGQVDALKDTNIRGMLIGDLTCNNTDIRGSSIQGNITTKGSTYIDNDSILLGDVKAQFASIDGKVKGDISVGSKVELQQNAIVAGNIDTNTISIEAGANVRGFINTTFLKEQGDSAFPNQVTINVDENE